MVRVRPLNILQPFQQVEKLQTILQLINIYIRFDSCNVKGINVLNKIVEVKYLIRFESGEKNNNKIVKV